MKALFAMAVGVLALVGCGPLDENETQTGQVAQELGRMPEGAGSGGPTLKPRTSDQAALYAPDRPKFENKYLYDTGIEQEVRDVPGSVPP